LKEQEVTLDSH